MLRVLGWQAAPSAACVQQYKEAFPRAAQRQKFEKTALECWSWVVRENPARTPELASIVGLTSCFLISETECERTFSMERRQFDHRPKLSPTMRFAGLKVMVDGVGLDELQSHGEPRSTFWECVQNRYADTFGSRFLTHVRRRKDAGQKRALVEVSPDGARKKATMASVQRMRGEAAQAPITFGAAMTNVFGYAPVAAAALERMRKEERSVVFGRIVERAQKKYKQKQDAYRQFQLDSSRPICFMSDRERQKAKRRASWKRQAFARSCLYGRTRLSWGLLARSMESNAGHPWFFLETAVQRRWRRSDPGYLDAEMAGKRFGDHVTSDLLRYTRSPAALGRRIMIVESVDAMPLHIRFAAALVRARVQETLCVPLLQFAQLHPVVITFTVAFAQAEKFVVQLARAASCRRVASFPEVRVVRLAAFWQELARYSDKKKRRQYHCIYASADDADLQGLSVEQAAQARSFPEFLGQFMPGKAALQTPARSADVSGRGPGPSCRLRVG